MLNCKQVSKLVSESIDKQLSVATRTKLWMHLLMCGICRQFRRTMLRVNQESQSRGNQIDAASTDQETGMPAAARDRIQQSIDSSLN